MHRFLWVLMNSLFGWCSCNLDTQCFLCLPWCHFRSIATAPCVVQPLPFLGRLVWGSGFFPRKDGGGERLKANQRHADNICGMVGKSWPKWPMLWHFVVISCFLFPAISWNHIPKRRKRSNRILHQDGFEDCRWTEARLLAKRMGWTYGSICFSLPPFWISVWKRSPAMFSLCYRF